MTGLSEDAMRELESGTVGVGPDRPETPALMRTTWIINDAISRLDEAERDAGMEWCRANNTTGLKVRGDGKGGLVVEWAERLRIDLAGELFTEQSLLFGEPVPLDEVPGDDNPKEST